MLFSDSTQDLTRKVSALKGLDIIRVRRLNLDRPLLNVLLAICGLGLVVLYSAVSQNIELWNQQLIRFFVGLSVMVVAAQLTPDFLRRWTPW